MRTNVISHRLSCFGLLFCLFIVSACGPASSPSSSQGSSAPTPAPVLDAYGTPITFPRSTPQRIVSLAPSISEELAVLGLQSRIVGVDFNTNYPADVAKLPKVSDVNGTYSVERIISLHPDLVLSSGGLTKNYDNQLKQLHLDVVDLPSVDFDRSIQQLALIGRLTGTQDKAITLVKQLQAQVQQFKASVAGTTPPKVLLEVDDSTPGKPYVFGGGSFGDQMLQYANAINIFHSNTTNGSYPQVTDEAIIAANPQYIVLTEDPAFGGNPSAVYKRPNWNGIDAVKNRRVYHINTDIMQRPGPRLVQGLRCIAQVVHPEKFPGALPGYCSASI
jgi:ABC-type Fe3+-hydroxamate transport system substrate-binding protein